MCSDSDSSPKLNYQVQGEQSSRGTEPKENRAQGEQSSRGAEFKGSRVQGEQSSRGIEFKENRAQGVKHYTESVFVYSCELLQIMRNCPCSTVAVE